MTDQVFGLKQNEASIDNKTVSAPEEHVLKSSTTEIKEKATGESQLVAEPVIKQQEQTVPVENSSSQVKTETAVVVDVETSDASPDPTIQEVNEAASSALKLENLFY
jgi:hypothetical protein